MDARVPVWVTALVKCEAGSVFLPVILPHCEQHGLLFGANRFFELTGLGISRGQRVQNAGILALCGGDRFLTQFHCLASVAHLGIRRG